MNGLLFTIFTCDMFQVHPLVTPQPKIESTFKVNEALILGEIYFQTKDMILFHQVEDMFLLWLDLLQPFTGFLE